MSVDVLVGSARVGEPAAAPRDGAFRELPSGLIVPAELSREREVWTWAEWRALEKATNLLASRSVRIFLKCEHPGCGAHPMERLRNTDGGLTLRCGHKDRIFRKDL